MDRWIGWLLNLVYLALLGLAAPLLAWQHVTGRKRRTGWRQRILGPDLANDCSAADSLPLEHDAPAADSAPSKASAGSVPRLWIHAVSVGEVNLVLGLLPQLRHEFPEARLAISASTDTGLRLARERVDGRVCVFRFPLDFSWAVSRVFRQWKPDALLLTELEVWPNTIAAAVQAQVPVIVVNARLSENSFRSYRRMAWLFQRWFSRIDLVVAQTQEYADRFVQLGVPASQVVVAGSVKFDAARTDRQQPGTRLLRERFLPDDQRLVWLAGSTSDPEESMVLDVYQRVRTNAPVRLVLVPRHTERFATVERLARSFCQKHGWNFLLRSAVSASSVIDCSWDVLLVDTIGELSDWWGCADVGFVGGSFGKRGGQSMIEPAGYGVATCFGPRTGNFRDVVSLLQRHQAAETVDDAQQMEQFVMRMVQDSEQRTAMGERARQLVQQQSGATVRTCRAIRERLTSGGP